MGMSTAKKLGLIAVGYVLAIVAGFAAVAVNELFMPADVAEGSPGMVAFGDMILFVLATGSVGLLPTWFLLKLFVDKAPRILLAIVLLVAAIGPASWLAVIYMSAGVDPSNPHRVVGPLLGLFIAFAAIPRMVLGPVVLAIEAVTFLLMRANVARALLAGAMLMDLIPLSLFALHMIRTARY